MTAGEPVYPAWVTHDGACTHPLDDPDHLALVRARFGGNDTIELITLLAPPAVATGGGTIIVWALPLLMLWRRREQRRARTGVASLLGVPLERLNLLVLTDRQLRFWELRSNGHGRRRHYTVGRQLGDVDRSLVVSISNRSAGDGWRTCQLALADGTSMAVRVSARSVPGLVAAFPEPGA